MQMTYATSNNGVALIPTDADRVKTPAGLVVTRAVETKSGWVGQIIVDKSIVWESQGAGDEREALQDANTRVVDRLKSLFGDDA